MKKILLLATVALVITAGSASAAYEICKLKGSATGYVYKDFSKKEVVNEAAVAAPVAAKPAEKAVETKKVVETKAVEKKAVEAKPAKVEKAPVKRASAPASKSGSSFGPYIGFDYSRAELNYYNNAENALEDDYDTYAVVAGLKFNKYFGAEVYAQNAAKESYRNSGDKLTSGYYSFGADLLGYLPVYGDLEVLGGIGFGYYKFKTKFVGAGEVSRDELYGSRYTAGLQYNLDSNWAVRAAYRYVNFSETDLIDHSNEYVAGIRYSF